MSSYQVEVTDTFGGEANYAWVRRYTIEGSLEDYKSRRNLVIDAKRVAGWSGLRCDTTNFGDELWLRPHGVCQIMFITWIDDLPMDKMDATADDLH